MRITNMIHNNDRYYTESMLEEQYGYYYFAQPTVDVTIECRNQRELWELKDFVESNGWIETAKVDKIIFSGPCTILIEENGSKTIVRCRNEKYNWKKGAIMVLAKRILGKKEWNDLIDRYRDTPKKETEAFEAVLVAKVGAKVLDAYLHMAEESKR